MISRRRFLHGSAASVLTGFLPALRAAAPEGARVATVIGNDAYGTAPLANAVNDAKAMAELLARAGFAVDIRTDTTAEVLSAAARDFGKLIARPQTRLAFFYFAGHGVQVDWRNYLLPVDANVTSVEELKRQCLDMGVLLEAMGKARERTFVVVLDACRDNPFGERWQTERKGLSQFDAPVGSLIAFSTAPGSVASDGPGRHGLYTENLVKELAVRGARIEDALKRVRLGVRLASKGAQIPWESTSLESDVYVLEPETALSAEQDEKRFEAEYEHWKRIHLSVNPDDWAAFLREYPNGRMSEIAQMNLDRLLRREEGRGGGKGRRTVPRLRLGSGLPVPDFLARSKNPYSAGTYRTDRHYTIGDLAMFRVLDGETGRFVRSMTLKVTRIDAAANAVELNGGNRVLDLLGNPIRVGKRHWDPPPQAVPAELQVGKRWIARFRLTKGKKGGDFETEFQVVRREKVVVPAGEFDAFRIEGATRRNRPGSFDPHPRGPAGGRSESIIWLVPGVNFAVKSEHLVSRPDDEGSKHDVTELVSLSQAGREDD